MFIGPFEHHSNELPWRESIAEDARVRGPFYMSVTENRLVLGDFAEAERYADRAHALLADLRKQHTQNQ